MKPKNSPSSEPKQSQIQLFQSRLDSQINLDHPLCTLANAPTQYRYAPPVQ
jgi:hypothetical protein